LNDLKPEKVVANEHLLSNKRVITQEIS